MTDPINVFWFIINIYLLSAVITLGAITIMNEKKPDALPKKQIDYLYEIAWVPAFNTAVSMVIVLVTIVTILRLYLKRNK